jgi:Tfp pilus assembly protein PilW
MSLSHRPAGRLRQRGLSLVELMVGIAVGMFIVAAAATLVASQLTDNRRMLLEVQVQQDLRAAADIITRELRRAGSWGSVDGAQVGISDNGLNPQLNPLQAVTPASGPAATEVSYSSSRAGTGATGPYRFKLEDGVIKSQLDTSSGWQPLTDASTMEVVHFAVTARTEPPVRVACPKLCSGGTQTCWPTVTVRSFVIDIRGRAVSDHAVVRRVQSVVRLRNDAVQFNDAANPTLACPA